jgi:hypothetical protein
VQQGNVTVIGAFRVPDIGGGSTFQNGGMGLAYDAAQNGLVIGGHPIEYNVAEVGIPSSPSLSTSVGSLPVASALHNFFDPTEGRRGQVGTGETELSGLLFTPEGLVVAASVYYDSARTATASHFLRSANLNVGGVKGPIRLGASISPGLVGGYQAAIPAAWQAALGGTAAAGQRTLIPITGRRSNGPAFTSYRSADLASGTSPVAATTLIQYDIDAGQQPSGGWNKASEVAGLVIPNGFSTALYIGKLGKGTECYGTPGSDCPSDPTSSDKGYHAYPYVDHMWAYNLNDLAAVKAGTKTPSQVQPYAQWDFSLPIDKSENGAIRGVAFDPATNRVFLSIGYADGDKPIVYVLQIH